MRCLIVSGGNSPKDELFLEEIEKANYLIAADKGLETFIKNNVKPDLVVGDFDSVQEKFKEELKNFNVLKFKPEKDLTDSEIAFSEALKKSPKELIFLGFTGTRLDHTLANIGLLKRALDKNINAYIIDNNNKMFIVNKPTVLKGEPKQIISFQAYCSEVNNFFIKKAKYPLKDYTLKLGDPRTVSNEFLKEDIEISFSKGEVLVIYARD